MSNIHLRDKILFLKAKCLLSFMFSLADNWDYSLMDIEKLLMKSCISY